MGKSCIKCGDPLPERKQKFCGSSCQYWYTSIKKSNESHLPPVKKRTAQWMRLVVGSTRAAGRGQGRRCNGMIKGGMSAMVMVTIEEIVPTTKENIERHLKGIPGHCPTGIKLGNGEFIKTEDILKKLGIKVNKPTPLP